MQREYPEEEALTRFFGAQPILADEDCPWYFNTLSYSASNGSAQVVCTLKPFHGVLNVQVFDMGKDLTAFTLSNISKISIAHSNNLPTMTIEFPQELKICPVYFQLRPKIKICRKSPVCQTQVNPIPSVD